MSRATSAGVYGSGTPANHGLVPAKRARRAYALRSASTPDGYVSAYGQRPRRTTRKEVVDTVTNLVAPVVPDDDAPVRRFVREVSPVVAFDRENRPDYN